MKDRIQQIIDYKGITPSELAVQIDVQRSSISHILNGRNKPGAAFLEKFLLIFPDIDARWLLTGQGKMVADSEIPAPVSTESAETMKREPQAPYMITPQRDKPLQKERPDDGEPEQIILLFSNGTFKRYGLK